MKSLVVFLALTLASSAAQAAQYLCTQRGSVRPIYVTINAPEARITAPPSFEQVVVTMLSKPSDLPRGYVAEYTGTLGCTGPRIAQCKAIQVKSLLLSEQVANGAPSGNIRYDGTLYKCSLGDF